MANEVVFKTNDGISILFKAVKITTTVDNANKPIPIPLTGSKQRANEAPETKYIDIKKLIFRIAVSGFLMSDSTSTAWQKYLTLLSLTNQTNSSAPDVPAGITTKGILLTKYNQYTLTYRGTDFTVGFEKITIEDDAKHDQGANPPNKLEVSATFIVGTSFIKV